MDQQMVTLHQTVESLTTELELCKQKLCTYAQTEEALRASEERFRILIEHNADAMIVISDGIVQFVNPSAENLFQRTADELLGKELGIPLVASDKAEVDIFDRHGQRFVAEMRVVEIAWEGTPSHLASFRDVTARKQMAEELERRVEERTAMLRHTLQQLSAELVEREKSEKAILRRDAILEAIEFAAHRFLKSSYAEQEIPLVLEYVGQATLVTRVVLFTIQHNFPVCSSSQLITSSTGHPINPITDHLSENQASPLSMKDQQRLPKTLYEPPGPRNFSRWYEHLHRGFTIYGDVRTFPPDEQQVLQKEGIFSLVVVPVFVEQQWWGFIEFDEVLPSRTWLLAEVEALRAAASMIGTAIQHGRVLDALRASEDRFRTVADFTYGWEYWMSTDGQYLYVSPSCERVTGYAPDTFQKNPSILVNICHPDDQARMVSHIEQESKPGYAGEYRFRILTASGEERWIDHVCQPVYDSQGQWLGQRGSNRDVTEQVVAEEALKREQHLFIGGPVVVFKWVAGDDWLVDYVSPNVTQFGYHPEDFTTGTLRYKTIIHPDDQERVSSEVHHYTQNNVTCFEQDYRLIRSDNEVRWVYVFMRTVATQRGNVTHYDGYVLDITDRKRTEEALRRSEERYRALVEGTDDLILQMDVTGRVTFANHVAEYLFGVPVEDCLNKLIFDFIHPDDQFRTKSAFEMWLKNRSSSVTFENRIISRSGEIHHMHWAVNLFYDYEGKIIFINSIVRDLTTLKHIEQALRESESRYRTISELVSDFAYALNVEPDGRLLPKWVTDAFSRITGFTMQEVRIRGGWESLAFPDDLPLVRESYRRLLSGQQSDVYEFRIMTRNSELRWLRNHSRPMWDKSQGRVAYIYGGMQDVTEWKQAMEALQESEQKFHCFFDQSRDGLVLMNRHGYIIEWNKGAEYIWKQKLHEVIGLPLWDVMFEMLPSTQKNDDGYEQLKASTLALLTSESVPSKLWPAQEIEHPDGEHCFIDTLLFHIQTDKGLLFGAIMRDVTEQRRTEDALREYSLQLSNANVELTHAVRVKDEFLANMSHELRTPLNGILGMTESLQAYTYGMLNDRQMKALRTIESSGRHLLLLINDILDLSQIESGKMKLTIEPIAIETVCQLSLQFVEQQAQKKRISVEYTCNTQHKTIPADAHYLQQMLTNLLNNAIKFTPESGRIGLDVSDHPEHQQILFTVWDTGIGIAPEHIGKLFRAFEQVDSSSTRQYQGTGLGLTLVAKLTELHHGRVQVDSILGQGSRFTISLPTQIPKYHTLQTHDAEDRQPEGNQEVLDNALPTILLIEDDTEITQLITDYLEYHHYRVVVAHHSQNKLDGWACQWQSQPWIPALILVDVPLPLIGGLTIIHQLRSHHSFSSTPIVAMTELVMLSDRDHCLQAGATDCIGKPINLKALLRIIQLHASATPYTTLPDGDAQHL